MHVQSRFPAPHTPLQEPDIGRRFHRPYGLFASWPRYLDRVLAGPGGESQARAVLGTEFLRGFWILKACES